MVGTARADLNFGEGGAGHIQSALAGVYATYLDNNGFYLDSVLKFNRFDSHLRARDNMGQSLKGHYVTHGIGLDVEVGKQLLLDNQWFVEPQLELTATYTQGGKYTVSNGLRVDAAHMNSLQSRVGSLFGRSLSLGNDMLVQPYVKASWITEHAGASSTKINGHRLNVRLPGDRLELGAGGMVQFTERSKAFIDAEYANGNGIEQPWAVTLGYRHLW